MANLKCSNIILQTYYDLETYHRSLVLRDLIENVSVSFKNYVPTLNDYLTYLPKC